MGAIPKKINMPSNQFERLIEEIVIPEKISEVFLSLFEKEEQQDWRVMRERVAGFAANYNDKFNQV
jgi:hypothetical protein